MTDEEREAAKRLTEALGGLVQVIRLIAPAVRAFGEAIVKLSEETSDDVQAENATDHAVKHLDEFRERFGQDETTEPLGTFPDELVERAYDASLTEGDIEMLPFARQTTQTKERARSFTSAILAELAKTPMEFATVELMAFRAAAFANSLDVVIDGYEVNVLGDVVSNAINKETTIDHGSFISYAAAIGHVQGQRAEHARIAPILAAKDAENARLGRMIDSANAAYDEAARGRIGCEQLAKERGERIAELEKQLAERDARIETIGKFPGVKEALQRVRTRGQGIVTAEHAKPIADSVIGCFNKIIDDEVDSLEWVKPTPAPVPVVFRMCANCGKPEGMHYDPNAKADTCCNFNWKLP